MIGRAPILAAEALWHVADGIRASADALERVGDAVNGLGHGILDAYHRLEELREASKPTQESIDEAIRAGLDPDELRDLDAASITFYVRGGA